jgi:hypothetical protein
MIYRIIDLPANVIGFKALWDVTRQDFEEVVYPCVQNYVEKMGQTNYLLVLNSSVRNFTFCAWLKDVLLVIKNLTGWSRAAIVTDSKALKMLTSVFNFFIPGEFRGFEHSELRRAIDWVSGNQRNSTGTTTVTVSATASA